MTVIATGWSPQGDRWDLDLEGTRDDLDVLVTVTRVDGARPWGTGTRGPALRGGRHVHTTWGQDHTGPRTMIARVSAAVDTVVVTLSDGTREDLVLHGSADEFGARVGVLVYPRELDVHRVDLYDADGAELRDRLAG